MIPLVNPTHPRFAVLPTLDGTPIPFGPMTYRNARDAELWRAAFLSGLMSRGHPREVAAFAARFNDSWARVFGPDPQSHMTDT